MFMDHTKPEGHSIPQSQSYRHLPQDYHHSQKSFFTAMFILKHDSMNCIQYFLTHDFTKCDCQDIVIWIVCLHKRKFVYQKLGLSRKMSIISLNIGSNVSTLYLLSRQRHQHFSGWGGEVNNPIGTMLQTDILIK